MAISNRIASASSLSALSVKPARTIGLVLLVAVLLSSLSLAAYRLTQYEPGSSSVKAQVASFFAGFLLAAPQHETVVDAQPCAQTRHENIRATSRHYLPGETVTVTGSGFAPMCDVSMLVNSPDESADSRTATTDASGNLSYSFVLGNVTGAYSIQSVTAGISLATTQFTNGIYVTTNKTDYLPGETVSFSGRGFTSGETIRLTVTQQYPGGAPIREFTTTADGSGSFINNGLTVGENDRDTTLRVVATGQTSGLTAETTFSDAAAVFVQKDINQTTATAVTSITKAYGSNPTAGNFLVAIVSSFGVTTITAPSGWSTAINQTGTATLPSQAIFYKTSVGAADNSVTAGFSPASTGTIIIQEFSNVLASSDPFDGANSNSGNATASASTGTLTPTSGAGTDLLIAGLTAETAGSQQTMAAGTVTGGFTVETPNGTVNGGGAGSQKVAAQSADKKTSGAGESTGFTITGTGVPASVIGWRGQIAAFKTKTTTTTTLTTSPVSPSVFSQPVTLTATINNAAATGSVIFTRGSFNCVAPVAAGVAQCVTSTFNLGTANITADYSGDSTYAPSGASAVSYTVNKADTTASTPLSSYNPAPFGQSVTFTTTVTVNSPGTVNPADGLGSVVFRNGASTITGCGAVNISGGVATCTATLPAGTHSITAQFNAGSSNYNSSPVSTALSQVVNPAPTAGAGCNLVVDQAGPHTGEYLTIQGAVDALPNPGPCTIKVKTGTYNEAVDIDGTPANNNNSSATLESQRIVIYADPSVPAGSVIVTPAGLGAASDHAVSFANAKFMTLKGFTFGPSTSPVLAGATKEAVILRGSAATNSDITIDSNDIHHNAPGGGNSGGIGIGQGNARTWVINNLIRSNGRNGVELGNGGTASSGNPKYIVNNTFYANEWNGLSTPSQEDVYLVNNLFVGNGTQSGSTGGRFGISSVNAATPATKFVVNNMFYKNGNGTAGGDLDVVSNWFEASSSTDVGNRTTSGTEGAPGVAAPTAGCTFSDCLATHTFNEIFASAGSDFHLKTSATISPAIDAGVNSYVHLLTERVPGLDFEANSRPQDGDGNTVAKVDVGYDEALGVVTNATLTVIKHVVNDNGGTASANAWTLAVNSSNGGSGTGSAAGAESPGTTYTLQAGKAYNVTESGGPSGYSASSSTDCTIASAVSGTNYTCTITNDDIAPTLNVIKHVVNDNGGNALANAWTLAVNSSNGGSGTGSAAGAESPGTQYTIQANKAYSVTESGGPSGYSASSSTDCSISSAVLNTVYTCTITNDDIAPKLNVIKHVVNDNGGTALANAWNLAVNSSNGGGGTGSAAGAESPGTQYTIQANKAYAVTESGGPSGYAASSSTDCSIANAALDTIYTCTITNDDIAPKLNVIKHVVNDNGGTALANAWTLTVASSNGGSGTGNAAGAESPGTQYTIQANKAYGVTESGGPSGYAASSSTDCTIANAVLDTVYTCTITNDDIAPKLNVIKHVVTDNGGTASASNWTLAVNSSNGGSGTGSAAGAESPGTQYTIEANKAYGVTESGGPSGYAASSSTDCTIANAVLDTIYTCTITNDDIAPTLNVIKHVVNDNGGNASASAWTLAVNSSNGGSGTGSAAGAESPGTQYTIEANKAYGVTESGGPGGYAASSSTDCTIANAVLDTIYTCTYTNNDIAPTITVNKVLSPSTDPGRFNLRIDSTSYATNVGDGGTTNAVPVMANATHTVDETGGTVPPTSLANYNSTISCGGQPVAGSSIAVNGLQPGQNVTCTITNNIIDSDLDGIPDFLDCTPTLYTDRMVDPAGTLAAYLPPARRHATLQAAVIAAADDDVIGMAANTTENVVIGSTTGSGGKDLRITGCGKKITGAVLTKPVVTTEVSAGLNDGNTGEGEADIHIDDLDVTKGSIGYLIQTSKILAGNNTSTLLKSIRSDSNTGGSIGIGIKIEGNGNEVRGSNSISNNTPGDGIQVIGDKNILRSNRSLLNKGDGIDVAGNSNVIDSNTIGDKSKGNKANGIVVNGAGNDIDENNVYASTLLGIKVTGNLNQVTMNDVGEQDKANLGGGILVAGNGSFIKENNIYYNTGVGMQVNGDTNVITTNDIGESGKGNTGNGLGVTGSSNTLEENNVFGNGGVGILITGNTNTLYKNDVGDRGKGNTLDGIRVVGAGNTLTENDSYANGFNSNGTANGGDGFDISGGTAASPNVLVKNTAGSGNAGNGGNGFLLAGVGNGTASPAIIELEENTAKANKLVGFKITGTGWQLAKNTSGASAGGSEDNVKYEFEVAAGNFNATGNKANGVTIAGAMNSAFPTAGQGTP